MKDPEYFNPREVLCWITGGKRLVDARKEQTASRKNHRRRNMAHRAKLYAHA
jgi:hypothetical protein